MVLAKFGLGQTWFGQTWSWPNLVWPDLVLAKLGLAKLGFGQTWIWPNLVRPNWVIVLHHVLVEVIKFPWNAQVSRPLFELRCRRVVVLQISLSLLHSDNLQQ